MLPAPAFILPLKIAFTAVKFPAELTLKLPPIFIWPPFILPPIIVPPVIVAVDVIFPLKLPAVAFIVPATVKSAPLKDNLFPKENTSVEPDLK